MLRRVIESIAFFKSDARAVWFRPAVVMTPVPSGLDKTSESPTCAPPLVINRSGWARPSATSPYLGS